MDALRQKFGYILDQSLRPLPGTAKPEGSSHVVEPGQEFTVGDARVLALRVSHGPWTVLGYRIGPLAYITDAKVVPPETVEAVRGVRVLVINALFRTEHPTHLSIPEAVRVAREVGAERSYLTHLTHDNLHADLESELPRGVAPAFDGLTIRIDEP